MPSEFMIIVDEDLDISEETHRGRSNEHRGKVLVSKKLNFEALKDNLSSFIEEMDNTFSELLNNRSAVTVSDITIHLCVNSEGKISFLGTGVSGSVEAGISVKLAIRKKD